MKTENFLDTLETYKFVQTTFMISVPNNKNAQHDYPSNFKAAYQKTRICYFILDKTLTRVGTTAKENMGLT